MAASLGSSTTKICVRVHQQLLLCQFKNGQSVPVKKKFTTFALLPAATNNSRILHSQILLEQEKQESNQDVRVNSNESTTTTPHKDNNSFSNKDSLTSPLVRLYNRFRDFNDNVNNKTSVPSETQTTTTTCCYHSHISNEKWWQKRPQRHHHHNIAGQSIRHMSSMRSPHQPISMPEYQVNPYLLIDDDLKEVYDDIRLLIRKNTNNAELHAIGTYYFDGQGKAFRPMVITLMARALNTHMNKETNFLQSQKEVAMIAEMIHIASLIHDDVIDQAELRRGKPSANVLWNQKKVAMAGDFILAVASMMIARLKNDEVTLTLSEVITDLVQGEFMQLGSKETENERFAHYLTKTYRKTASLIANSLKSVAILAAGDEQTCELAYQYGRNLGLAFQLVDDLLDFVSSAEEMGKPTAADLKLGLATAPVLFACEKYPELTPMIMRRFGEPGDCERAFELVHKSQGLKQTQFLAQQHCMEAARLANTMAPSPHQKALGVLTDLVLNRMK